MLFSDPYETLGHIYHGEYSDFTATMQEQPFPFTNIYTSQDGFIARQIQGNDRKRRLLTWELSRNLHSFVTIPLSVLISPHQFRDELLYQDTDIWPQFAHGERFAQHLAERGLEDSRVLDLNMLLFVLIAVVSRHRTLAGFAGVKGPFYIKANIENVWRAIPFLDIEEYLTHVNTFDVPVIQDSDLTAPYGALPGGSLPHSS